eukprot:m51a1_g12371 hypothetical protein (257) ;mRNA; r:603642-604664
MKSVTDSVQARGTQIASFFGILASKVRSAIEAEQAELRAEEDRVRVEAAALALPAPPPAPQDQHQQPEANAPGSPDAGVLAPWDDLGPDVPAETHERIRELIFGLTKSRRNFVNGPAEDDESFLFELQAALPAAMAALRADPRLDAARAHLVPRKVRERKFWRNWFYRVHVIKSRGVASSEAEAAATTSGTGEDGVDGQWEEELKAALQGVKLNDAAVQGDSDSGAAWEDEVEQELAAAAAVATSGPADGTASQSQ